MLTAINRNVWKLPHKSSQQLIEMLFSDLRAKPVKSSTRHLGVALFAVMGDERVADLIDQSHGKERPRMNRAFRIVRRTAHLVHAICQFTAGREIAKNNVANKVKQHIADLIAIPGFARNVKLHHDFPLRCRSKPDPSARFPHSAISATVNP
ncbi:hypothetical protein [Paracidobacterium acidisoli]|uniref:hypothetical protein n=1 Tax=Paracidobacterium acidisoli TaxID=2303751 RepID=UPI00207A2785|nr:hypothetical protein [Paracidobacterium acidisoli]